MGYIDVPVFTGIDLPQWIDWMDDFFDRREFTDLEKLAFAPGFIAGEAESWFDREQSLHPFMNWLSLKFSLWERFVLRRNTSTKARSVADSGQNRMRSQYQSDSEVEIKKYKSREDLSDQQIRMLSGLLAELKSSCVTFKSIQENESSVDEEEFMDSEANTATNSIHERETCIVVESMSKTKSELLASLLETKEDIQLLQEEKLHQRNDSILASELILEPKLIPPISLSHIVAFHSQVSSSRWEPGLPFCIASLVVVDVLHNTMAMENRSHSLLCVHRNAHHVFDTMPLEVKLLKNRKKEIFSKTWWFKFKYKPKYMLRDKSNMGNYTSLEKEITLDRNISILISQACFFVVEPSLSYKSLVDQNENTMVGYHISLMHLMEVVIFKGLNTYRWICCLVRFVRIGGYSEDEQHELMSFNLVLCVFNRDMQHVPFLNYMVFKECIVARCSIKEIEEKKSMRRKLILEVESLQNNELREAIALFLAIDIVIQISQPMKQILKKERFPETWYFQFINMFRSRVLIHTQLLDEPFTCVRTRVLGLDISEFMGTTEITFKSCCSDGNIGSLSSLIAIFVTILWEKGCFKDWMLKYKEKRQCVATMKENVTLVQALQIFQQLQLVQRPHSTQNTKADYKQQDSHLRRQTLLSYYLLVISEKNTMFFTCRNIWWWCLVVV